MIQYIFSTFAKLYATKAAMLKITPIKDVANADRITKLVFPSAKLDLRVLFVPKKKKLKHEEYKCQKFKSSMIKK
jgi:hypothetical protein